LRDYPEVSGPTIDMISAPDNPYVKLLLILGRDDQDLVTASKGIAQGNVLMRGQSVQVEAVTPLAPRVPYDAPNWVRLD
ncbi:cellulose biosynthesis cyclic di-GMP-binding regulatory protein BcsB, partial [Vibrio cholerae O1]|nr:cellulose biosynthesis cyclic di-GMP-binding regulatory protein BcsB [Vibrio cholerae O1]